MIFILFRRPKQPQPEQIDLPNLVTTKPATKAPREQKEGDTGHRLQYAELAAQHLSLVSDQREVDISRRLRYPENL